MCATLNSKVSQLCDGLEGVSQQKAKGSRDDEGLSVYKGSLEELLALIGQEVPDDSEKRLLFLTRVTVVAAGHSAQHYWTNADTRKLANELLYAVCRVCGHDDCGALLAQETALLESIFNYLKSFLTKENWQNCPVHKQTLVWCALHLKHPNIAPQLAFFLPPALWMMEDYLDYHKTLALSLLSHIIQNMNPTELRWHGRADLLYQAMTPLLYTGNPEVVVSLHPCLLQLLFVLDYSPHSPVIPAKPSKTDEVFSILISSLAKESKLPLLRAYTSQVKGYILQLGIFSVRHLKELLPLLLSGLNHSDPNKEKLRVFSLESLLALMSCAWPRISPHKTTILKALSQLVQELFTVDSSACPSYGYLDDITSLVIKCLTTLMTVCPQLKEDYQWLEKSCSHPVMQSCLQQALAFSQR